MLRNQAIGTVIAACCRDRRYVSPTSLTTKGGVPMGKTGHFSQPWVNCADHATVEGGRSRMMGQPVKNKDALRQGLVMLVISLSVLGGCGTGGESDVTACTLCGPRNDIRGSISSLSGSQAQMAGWVVAAIERDTGIARVSEVDGAGIFTFKQTRTEKPQTLILLSQTYQLRSVLSIPNEKLPTSIKQFVQFQSPALPRLIHRGSTITFQDYLGIAIMKDLAADADSDGIPDGLDPMVPSLLNLSSIVTSDAEPGFALQTGAIDKDLDGVSNQKDPDIDGDGIINWLDHDDDGNQILDPFDPDQNGDLEKDDAPGQQDIDLYFKEGIEYLAVQYELKATSDGSPTKPTIKFTTKVRNDVPLIGVQIRGSVNWINRATYTTLDSSGQPTVVGWNRQLADDGQSEDNNPDDRIFSKKIILDANDPGPQANEVVFFQLVSGTPEKPWFLEFPYTFPDTFPVEIKANYRFTAGVGVTVSLENLPFPKSTDFIWSVNLWDKQGEKIIWTSEPKRADASTQSRELQIPTTAFEPGAQYKFNVVGQSLDKVPGYPAFTVHSIRYPTEAEKFIPE